MAAPTDSAALVENGEENTDKSDISDKQTLLAVLQFLRKNNLKATESLLINEAKLSDEDVKTESTSSSESDVLHALAAYKSDDDPTLYNDFYSNLKSFIESCLDIHKVELSTIFYPVFVHMYLELVYNRHEEHAKSFFQKYSKDQEFYYQDDLHKLSTVTTNEHMRGNQLMENFKSSKFVLRMSRDSYTHLKRHLQETQMKLLINIIQEHLFIDVFDGVPRNKEQIQTTSGGLLGEAEREGNKCKVFYGLLKEPDLNIPLEDDEDNQDEDKPKKKRAKKDFSMFKKSKNDPNAPQVTRIPLAELKDFDKMEKINSYKDAMRRMKLGADNLPSICFYTFLNSHQGVTCIDISEDSSLMCAGFQDSLIRVWSLTPTKLRAVKSPSDLSHIDREADDVLERMMDDRTASDSKTLIGHSGPVYSTSLSPDRNYMVSSSEDGTIRLWSLQTWTNLVCYKGHVFPVFDVKFSPHGHYFVSCGHDRTARLWSTDHYQPLRLFVGHLSDVDSVQFHPNSNYVATGSSDRVVRLWDVLSGNSVRALTGHKGSIHSLCFSPDGKYLASGGSDFMVLLWEISTGTLIAQFKGHTETVYSLAFSRDGSILASGGLDCIVHLWDIHKVLDEQDTDGDANIPSSLHVNDKSDLLLGVYRTKSTPVLALHFTRKNLLLASGPFVYS